MKKGMITLLLIIAGLFHTAARADVLVLVHGYLSGAQSWDASGITAVLGRNGWQRAGVYAAGPAGVQLIPMKRGSADHTFYTVDLPSEAPVLVQAFQLRQILQSVSQLHAGESIVVVGHSAGGVVARAALVRGQARNVKALITIATPHLGTYRAEQALDATDIPFPFSIVTDVLGGEAYDTAMRSRSLYVDLVRPRPGSLLFWLNNEPHPDIQYFSIVRGNDAVLSGDYVVPGYSQDMNNVPVLRGKSSRISIPREHGLDVLDGNVIVTLLDSLS
ncbi:MAG: alpha/beta fold hydrolase [Gammaproteobacteria bacterium]|nr:alpha/beta fold hydrolase [Gammaproteobacteria bacterium]